MSTRAGAGPRHFAFHPSGKHTYVINKIDSTITVYDYESLTGSFTERQTLSTLPADYEGENWCADVQVHPSGRLLFGTNRGHDSIAVMPIDELSGELTTASHVPSGGGMPWNLEIDPSGGLLLVANQGGNNVTVFAIDQKRGEITPTGSSAQVIGAVFVKIIS